MKASASTCRWLCWPCLTMLTGLVYPLVVTGVAQLLFPLQANGSLYRPGRSLVGSELIGQPFDDPRYFWGRPSATAPFPYNAGSLDRLESWVPATRRW